MAAMAGKNAFMERFFEVRAEKHDQCGQNVSPPLWPV
jgi:hypothetical protein